jgi:hypothetical protein
LLGVVYAGCSETHAGNGFGVPVGGGGFELQIQKLVQRQWVAVVYVGSQRAALEGAGLPNALRFTSVVDCDAALGFDGLLLCVEAHAEG